METLAGSRTAKREGDNGPADPRKTNVNFGKEKTLYRTSSQSDLVNHFNDPKNPTAAKANQVYFLKVYILDEKMYPTGRERRR